MKVVIPGGSGRVGTILARAFVDAGHEVVVLSRQPRSVNCRYTPANRRAILWLIGRDGFEGAVNVAAPNPVPNAEFMRTLRAAWGVRFGLPAAAWMLEVGAALLRTETELILKSRRVIPGRLQSAGFTFQFPAWTGAARDLCERHRRRPAR